MGSVEVKRLAGGQGGEGGATGNDESAAIRRRCAGRERDSAAREEATASWTPSASSPSEKQRPRKKQNRGGRTNLTWRPWRGERRDRSAGEAAALAMELDGRGHEKKRDQGGGGTQAWRGKEATKFPRPRGKSSAGDAQPNTRAERCACGPEKCQLAKNANLVSQTVGDEIFLFCQIF